jgi:hypothetical protein
MKRTLIVLAIGLMTFSLVYWIWTVKKSVDEKFELVDEEVEAISKTEHRVDDTTNLGDRPNPLYGIIYRDNNEVTQLKDYKEVGGSIIDNVKDNLNNFKFGFSEFKNSTRHVITFERIISQPNNSQVEYQILDTLNIDVPIKNGYISYCTCRQDTTFDYEIIALVIAEDKEYYDKIIRAWRADTKTGKIYPLKNVAGINCVNRGYRAD